MSKVYSHAGVSSLNGEFKVRFCNDALRVKVLAKNGHKDIDIIELKNPMTKEDIVAFLISIDFANGNKAVQAALEQAADKRGVTAPKAVVAKPKAKAPAKKVEVPADAEPALM
jgi:2-iminoacetate synthase ThiH